MSRDRERRLQYTLEALWAEMVYQDLQIRRWGYVKWKLQSYAVSGNEIHFSREQA